MKLRQWLSAFSLKGVAPQTMALSVTLALLLGVFPVYGCPTLLCAAAALMLRLNLPAMQLVNLLTSPLQLALLVPFGRLGGRLVHVPAAAAAHAGAWHIASGLGAALIHAVAGWCMVAAPLGILLCLTLGWARGGRASKGEARLQLQPPVIGALRKYSARSRGLVGLAEERRCDVAGNRSRVVVIHEVPNHHGDCEGVAPA